MSARALFFNTAMLLALLAAAGLTTSCLSERPESNDSERSDQDPPTPTFPAPDTETPQADPITDDDPDPAPDPTPDTTTDTPTTSSRPDTCAPHTLNDWEQMMLDAHNEWRASVDPPAKFMRRLYWDQVLAQHAADWISSCNPRWPHSPDSYRENIGGYKNLGENLSYCGGVGCEELPTVQDGSGLGTGWGWWEERHYYDWYNDEETTGPAAHYIHMVSANTYAIGCATQRCDAPGPNGWDDEWWWVSCLYGPRAKAYWNGTKPYKLGDGKLIEPKASIFDEHPGLCAN